MTQVAPAVQPHGVWAINTPEEVKLILQQRPTPKSIQFDWFEDPASPLRGFPKQVTGKSVWYGDQLEKHPEQWIYHLNQEEISEIDAAVQSFILSKKPFISLAEKDGKIHFPLPKFGSVLRQKRNDSLFDGIGILLFRGFPIEKYGAEERAAMFLGVGSYLGVPMSQNGKGHLLGHVKDLGLDPANPNTRIYATNERQWFHTDCTDIVGLLCIQVSEEGGESAVASSHTVYNEIVRRRPDLAAVLASDFYWDRKNEIPEGKLPFWKAPLYWHHDGKLLAAHDRNYLIHTSRHNGAQSLTVEQWEALDLLEEISLKTALKMVLQPGDMQWVFNHKVFHSREKYRDSSTDPALRRHLLRLWLTTEHDGGWELPEAFADRFGRCFPNGVRAGVLVPGVPMRVPLDAE